MKDLVSIVVIAYNAEDYIEDCINSVLEQSYKNLEIVVVNDGSKDSTAKIIDKYAKKDNRIKFINRQENKGTMYTRKEGYENTSGKYITFVDSDDMLDINAIEIMYNEIKNNNCEIVKCGFAILKKEIQASSKFSLNKKTIYCKENFEPEFYDLIYKTIIMNTMCGMLIKKQVLTHISKVNTDMIYGEDITNNLYMYNNINKIVIIPDNIYIYRYNENSITNTINSERIEKKLKDSIITYKQMYDFVDKYKIKDQKRYRGYACDKLKWYVTSSLITLCSVNNYKAIKRIINDDIINKENANILNAANKAYTISGNKPLRIAINLLFNKKLYFFYMYSKYIYFTMKKVKRMIK